MLRLDPIDGVQYRLARPVSHQANVTVKRSPERIRA